MLRLLGGFTVDLELFEGDGGFLFHFILSKILAFLLLNSIYYNVLN